MTTYVLGIPREPDGVTTVTDRDGDLWTKTDDGKWTDRPAGGTAGPCSWVSLWDVFGPITWEWPPGHPALTEDEPTPTADGAWVEVDADDVKDGARVRLGGVEGVAANGGHGILFAAAPVGGGEYLWSIRRIGGRVEVWQPTLPLPAVLGLFWGRAPRADGTTYEGWLMGPDEDVDFLYILDGRLRTTRAVTRVPIPADVREALQ